MTEAFLDCHRWTLATATLATFAAGYSLWMLLRRQARSLGFRFAVTSVLLTFGATWLFGGEAQVCARMAGSGERLALPVLAHAAAASPRESWVEVEHRGRRVRLQEYVSEQEARALAPGTRVDVWWDPERGLVAITSFARMREQAWIPALALGLVIAILLALAVVFREHRVGSDEEGREWLEDPQGRVLLDERKHPSAQRRGSSGSTWRPGSSSCCVGERRWGCQHCISRGTSEDAPEDRGSVHER